MTAIQKGDMIRATHAGTKTVLEGLAFMGHNFHGDDGLRVELLFSSPLLSHLESNRFTIEKIEASA